VLRFSPRAVERRSHQARPMRVMERRKRPHGGTEVAPGFRALTAAARQVVAKSRLRFRAARVGKPPCPCGPPKAMKTRLSRHNGIKVFDCVFNGVPMARCGPPKAMKTRLSRRNGIKVFDRVFNGAVPLLFHHPLKACATPGTRTPRMHNGRNA